MGDRIELTNLANGEREAAYVNERGWFRLAVPADALDPVERRSFIELEGDESGSGSATDNTLLGDGLRLDIYVGDTDEVRATVDTFLGEILPGHHLPHGLEPGGHAARLGPDAELARVPTLPRLQRLCRRLGGPRRLAAAQRRYPDPRDAHGR